MNRFFLFFFLLFISSISATEVTAEPDELQTVRIAAFNFYPTMFQAKDGSVQGFYVDFLQEIAQREGWHIEYVYGNWADGLSRIKSGEVDVLTNVALTNERALFMDFGKVPLLTVWAELYVSSNSTIDNIRQVQGKRIALMKGDFNASNFRNLVEKFGIPCQFVEFGNFEEVFQAISSRHVDGGVVNNTFGSAKQSEYDVKSSGIIFNPFDIYFTVAKGKNQIVIDTLDKYLTEWRAQENSPYHRARERWVHKSASTIHVVPAWLRQALTVLVLVAGGGGLFIVTLRLQIRRKTAELNDQAAERKQIEETLFFINESGAHKRGEDLLSAINSYLGSTLAIDYAFVGQLLPDKQTMKTRGLYANGARGQDIEYPLQNTPCNNVVGNRLCFYPRDVLSQFPKDDLLVTMEAESYAATPLWDSHGNAIGLMGIIGKKPLQNRVLVETILQIVATRAAQELEAMIRLDDLELKNFTIENIQESVFWITREGNLWSSNKTAETMLGYTREELLAMTVADVDPYTMLETWPEQWQRVKEMGSYHFESVHRTKDGRDIPVEITASYFRYNEIEYQCAIARDISNQRHIEEQLRQSQKMEAIGLLAGGVAHDFNNILQVIMGYGNLLNMDNSMGEKQRADIAHIISSAEKAAQLTKGLLAFSRKQVMDLREANLNDIVQNIHKFLLRIIGEDIHFKSTLCEVSLPVRVDSSQIEQLLLNLATNARDAMPQGGLLSIESGKQTLDTPQEHAHGVGEPGQYAWIAVSDTGSGMDEETRSKIFEPFFTTKEVGKGTGLGMAIVYGVVKQHNGFINVYSEPGVGTTFKIYLPLITAEQPIDEGVTTSAPPEQGSETILLAEDDPSVRKLVVTVLTKFGYKVIQAADGQEAVDLFSANHDQISLVLMDVIMPKKNGRDAFTEIQQIKPDVKVLFSSGYTADFIMNRGVNNENFELIMKPVQPLELLRKLREMLGNRTDKTNGIA